MLSAFLPLMTPVLLLAADGTAPASPMDGTWKLVSIERDGKPRELAVNQPRWVIKNGKVYYGGEVLADLTIDAKATPPCIDLAYRRPKATFEGIYAVDKKTLTICVNRDAAGVKDRPQDFKTTELPNRRVLLFEREELREGAEFEGVIPSIGAQFRAQKGKGVLAAELEDEGNATRAGLKKGDVILKIGNTEMKEDVIAAFNVIRQSKPGTDLVITIKRDDKEQEIKVKVGVVPFRF